MVTGKTPDATVKVVNVTRPPVTSSHTDEHDPSEPEARREPGRQIASQNGGGGRRNKPDSDFEGIGPLHELDVLTHEIAHSRT